MESKNAPWQRRLRAALLANAMFSVVTGATLLAAPGLVGRWLGQPAPAVYMVIGGGLLAFAAHVAWTATRPQLSTVQALVISVADLGWVAGTAGLLAGWSASFSSLGLALIVAVAVAVFGFAWAQLSGVRAAYRRGATLVGAVHGFRSVVASGDAAL